MSSCPPPLPTHGPTGNKIKGKGGALTLPAGNKLKGKGGNKARPIPSTSIFSRDIAKALEARATNSYRPNNLNLNSTHNPQPQRVRAVTTLVRDEGKAPYSTGHAKAPYSTGHAKAPLGTGHIEPKSKGRRNSVLMNEVKVLRGVTPPCAPPPRRPALATQRASQHSGAGHWNPRSVLAWVTLQAISDASKEAFVDSGWDGDMLLHALPVELEEDLKIQSSADRSELLRQIASLHSTALLHSKT